MTSSPAATSSSSPPPARARRSPSASRWSTASRPTAPRPAALVLAPTRELATQIVEEIRSSPTPAALSITAVYGGVGFEKQARRRAGRTSSSRPRAASRTCSQRGAFTSPTSRCSCSTRPTGCSTWASGRRSTGSSPPAPSDRQTLFFSATLDGEAGEVATRYTRHAAIHEHGPSGRAAAAEIEHRFVSVSAEDRVETLVGRARDRARPRARLRADQARRRPARQATRRATASTAVAMHGDKSQRQREQALARFESGRDRHARRDRRRRARHRRRRASRTSSTSTRRTTTRPTSTASAAPAAPGRTGVGITLVGAAERAEVSKLARELGIDHGLGGSERERPAAASPARAGARPRRSQRRRPATRA